ncbi:hypothetical protein FHR32_006359 [Streptosporangium album]|uniref:Uncharacterized protein n=1 Tax=Streptosporangium album TaxID=47479 RepID=A0A7W7S140_9ACTN|nr:hypothetical protein [Streptosporangium album]
MNLDAMLEGLEELVTRASFSAGPVQAVPR